MARRPVGFALVGLAIAGATAAAVATSRPWPERLPLHLALLVGAGLLWALAIALLPRLRRGRGEAAVLVAIALLVRLPAWLAPPAHSSDVWRYAWDGRVLRAGINPYRFAPTDPALAPLREGATPTEGDRAGPERPTPVDGPLFARLNHRDLPTIYPPGAQLAFLLAASLPLPALAGIKLVLGAADLGVLAALIALLRLRRGDVRAAAAWGWSPLVAVELGQNAHLDALPLLAATAALLAWEARRPALAGLLLGAATATKLVTAPLLLPLRSARAWVAATAVMLALALPFVVGPWGAGARVAGSTGEFARRWRGNDGAFALLQAGAERLACRAIVAADGTPCAPLDLRRHPSLARAITGRDSRTAVYPDELAGFAARSLVALAIAALAIALAVRRAPPETAMEWLLGALVLLTPALHPWYATWLVPLVALRRRPAWIALAALAPLGYVPLAGWLAGGPWRDPIWTRAVEHGAAWTLLLADALVERAARRRARRRDERLAGELDPDRSRATIR